MRIECVTCGIAFEWSIVDWPVSFFQCASCSEIQDQRTATEIAARGISVDLVNHPPHYTSHPSGVECIQIARHMNFNLGNALKYIWRAGIKSEASHVQDLEKAVFYLNDEIQRLSGGSS